MNDLQLIGREEQVAQLDRCLGMTKPQLIVVYGRRRVGKTYLIDTYFDNRFAFKFTGVYRRRRKKQLSNFNKELSLKSGKQLPAFEDWDDAFSPFALTWIPSAIKIKSFSLTSCLGSTMGLANS